jgi:hypothetical protein
VANKETSGFDVLVGALQAGLEQQMSCSSPDAKQLSGLRTQIRQLIKFVALNYLAVVKAIKKRNRHCKVIETLLFVNHAQPSPVLTCGLWRHCTDVYSHLPAASAARMLMTPGC